jgi:hypothetical protein
MDFKYISGGFPREIGGTPGFCKNFIHHPHIRIDPEHSQVKRHEQHMNGRVQPRVAPAGEEQSLVRREAGPKGQTAQLRQEGVTVLDAWRISGFPADVANDDVFGHGLFENEASSADRLVVHAFF